MPYLCAHQPASHVHKTPAYFYLLNPHTALPWKREHCFFSALSPCAECVSVVWNCGTISEHSRFGCNHPQLKFNETETDTEFVSSLKTVSTDSPECLKGCTLYYFAQNHVLTQMHARYIQVHASLHTCTGVLRACRRHIANILHMISPCEPCCVKSSTVYRLDFALKRHRQEEEILKQKSVQFN